MQAPAAPNDVAQAAVSLGTFDGERRKATGFAIDAAARVMA
jgi:hypothetical protein